MARIEEILLTDLKHDGDLVKKPDSGDLQTVSGLENIRDALLRRLVTEPGSIIHRPDYGVGIKRFLNAPNSIVTQREIALRIEEQFERDPRVEDVLGVRIVSNDLEPSKTQLVVRVKLVGYGEQAMEFLPFGEVI